MNELGRYFGVGSTGGLRFEALWEMFDTRQRQLLPLPEPPPARLPLLPWQPLEPQLLLQGLSSNVRTPLEQLF